MLKTFIGILALIPCLAFASPEASRKTWSVDAQIDLTRIATSAQLAEVLSDLSQEVTECGEEVSCSYVSKIESSWVEGQTYHLTLDLSYSGNRSVCGVSGIHSLYEGLQEIEEITLGNLEEN